jgi:hypothetical protein
MLLIGRCMNEDATILEVRAEAGGLRITASGGSEEREAYETSLTLCETCGDTDCEEHGP